MGQCSGEGLKEETARCLNKCREAGMESRKPLLEFPAVAVSGLGELLAGCGRIMKQELSAVMAWYWAALPEKGTQQGGEV